MKLLLLILLTASATEHNISSQAVWKFNNAFECIIATKKPTKKYPLYGCYCGLLSWNLMLDDLNRCCRNRYHCYDQVNKLENCGSLIKNPFTTPYLYSCSKKEITCSDENKVCEAFICNCDRQAAICFSKTPYNKENEDIYC